MIEFMKHPRDLVQDLMDDMSLNGKNFATVVRHIRESLGVVPEAKDRKTVYVETLKRGDTFVLRDFSKEFPFVYIVTEVGQTGVDVTSSAGKVFTFGKKVPVIPVHLSFAVSFAEDDEK